MPASIGAAFVRRMMRERLPLEGVTIRHNGETLFCFIRDPQAAHNIYSQTKSFLSAAVGIAIDEGLLSLDDRPAAFFPQAVGPGADPALSRITLRHLLMMASGLRGPLLMNPSRGRGVGAPDYLRYILAQPMVRAPGTAFYYSNGDSYLIGRMLEKAAGQPLADYLQSRLLTPLSIDPPVWEKDPLGHTFAASGMCLTLEDMAKLGQLYLDGGKWQGRQIVPAAWVQASTARQIDVPAKGSDVWERDGYGYQFWRSPYPGAYRADGAYGQITTVLPESGIVAAIQCTESDCLAGIRAAAHETLLTPLSHL